MTIGTSAKNLAVVAALLGASSFGFLAPSASAQPNRQLKAARKDVKRESRDLRKAQQNLQREQRQSQVVVRPRTTIVRTRTVVRNRPVVRNSNTSQVVNYNGRVTYVSGRRVGINVGGNIFTVNTSSSLPRALNTGDFVRVSGLRTNNTINRARVIMVRNY
jgi:hypothetical protein